jgi:cell division protein FtsW (lipid II flippase)
LTKLPQSSIDKLQRRLLILAATFLGLYAVTITLAPAARYRSWQVSYPWTHWIGYLIWLVLFTLIHKRTRRFLPERDPYLLPMAGLLSGWGVLTISRLASSFGLRQSAWLLVALILVLLSLRLPGDLRFLQRYKYLWLTSGLLLTALTLFFGTNPLGTGPRLWLGCCGIYLQPSEPLKLLLIIYLSAYLADRQLYLIALKKVKSSPTEKRRSVLFPLLVPSLVMTGIAILLLIVQRDLGTASVFIFLYATIVYLASGLRRILWISLAALLLAGAIGYFLFDVVQLRVDAWLNPWVDPSGRSYQIVQSLLATASGGLLGRGPGMGNPGLVPVPHSDFIFVAIAEEAGLIGALALIGLLAVLLGRGINTALKAPTTFHRLLAAGLTAYLVGQSILIIGGNLRLLPLTGVTLPFVSYGGSSLVTSYLSLLLLLVISNQPGNKPVTQFNTKPYLNLGIFLIFGLAGLAAAAGWWGVQRGPDLLTRTDNARRAIADRYVRRGSLLSRDNQVLAETTGQPGDLARQVLYPALGSIIGYTHPVYGQAGLEASLDAYLRGTQGNPGLRVWWDHLLYGLPPPGLDVRLSLDLGLQQKADELLGEHSGGLVLLDAKSGEILTMVSHPTFDANQLDQTWPDLVSDPNSPLLNRATQGLYPTGAALGPFLLASSQAKGSFPSLPEDLEYDYGSLDWTCANLDEQSVQPIDWGKAISSGCPGAVASLGRSLGIQELSRLFSASGFFKAPQLDLPTISQNAPASLSDAGLAALGILGTSSEPSSSLRVSPLQMSLAAAALSNQGKRPAARLVSAVNTPQAGWVILPSKEDAETMLSSEAVYAAAEQLAIAGTPFWMSVARAPNGTGPEAPIFTWVTGGTTSAWPGSPLALAFVLEEDNPALAYDIGLQLLEAAIKP